MTFQPKRFLKFLGKTLFTAICAVLVLSMVLITPFVAHGGIRGTFQCNSGSSSEICFAVYNSAGALLFEITPTAITSFLPINIPGPWEQATTMGLLASPSSGGCNFGANGTSLSPSIGFWCFGMSSPVNLNTVYSNPVGPGFSLATGALTLAASGTQYLPLGGVLVGSYAGGAPWNGWTSPASGCTASLLTTVWYGNQPSSGSTTMTLWQFTNGGDSVGSSTGITVTHTSSDSCASGCTVKDTSHSFVTTPGTLFAYKWTNAATAATSQLESVSVQCL